MFQALKSLLNLLRRDLIAGWKVMGTAGMKSKGECFHSFTQLTTKGLTLGKKSSPQTGLQLVLKLYWKAGAEILEIKVAVCMILW